MVVKPSAGPPQLGLGAAHVAGRPPIKRCAPYDSPRAGPRLFSCPGQRSLPVFFSRASFVALVRDRVVAVDVDKGQVAERLDPSVCVSWLLG
jgi:hypothetical protein